MSFIEITLLISSHCYSWVVLIREIKKTNVKQKKTPKIKRKNLSGKS